MKKNPKWQKHIPNVTSKLLKMISKWGQNDPRGPQMIPSDPQRIQKHPTWLQMNPEYQNMRPKWFQREPKSSKITWNDAQMII